MPNRSPLDMMIDKACGYEPTAIPQRQRMLQRTQSPDEAALVAAIMGVVDAAKAWWVNNCPDDWDEARHLAQPTINCMDRTEDAIAKAVAEWVKVGG